MGLDESQESEGHDRTQISLPGVQNDLIEQVATASKGPVILIIISGGCVDIGRWQSSSIINAIAWGGYPGMYGGLAMSELLYGVFSPVGRLTQVESLLSSASPSSTFPLTSVLLQK